MNRRVCNSIYKVLFIPVYGSHKYFSNSTCSPILKRNYFCSSFVGWFFLGDFGYEKQKNKK